MKLYFILPKILELLDINIQFNIFNIIYGLPFAVLGLSLAAYGFILMGKKIGKILTFKPVKGMVVGYARDADMNDCYGIVSEYVVNDLTYSVNSINKTSDMKSRYSIGSAVKLKYNPKNPSDAIYIDDDGYIFAILIGIAIFIMGFITMLSWF